MVILIISLIVAVIGAAFAFWGLKIWSKALRRSPRLLRPARNLTATQVERFHIDAVKAWTFGLGDEDCTPPLLIEQPDGRFVLITGPEVDDLFLEDDHQTGRDLRQSIVIEQCFGETIRAITTGERVRLVDIDATAEDEFAEVIEDVEPLTETHFDALPQQLQRVIQAGR